MRASLSITAVVAVALSGRCFASEIPKFDQSMLVTGNVREEQRPDYPFEARRNHIQGNGIFILNITARTGRVDSIQIKKSTGHKILDVAAMKAFITYRFKPHTVTKVWIPIDFKMWQT